MTGECRPCLKITVKGAASGPVRYHWVTFPPGVVGADSFRRRKRLAGCSFALPRPMSASCCPLSENCKPPPPDRFILGKFDQRNGCELTVIYFFKPSVILLAGVVAILGVAASSARASVSTNLAACTCIREVILRVSQLEINPGPRGQLLKTLEQARRQVAVCHAKGAGKRMVKFVRRTQGLVALGTLDQDEADQLAVCARTIDLCRVECDISGANLSPVALAKSLILSADSQCQATCTASQFDNGSFDTDGIIISRSVTPPGPYPLGETLVTYTVVDNGGAFSSVSASVLVQDESGPAVSGFSPNFVVPVALGQLSGTAVFPAPTVNDSCSGVAAVSFLPPSGTVFPVGVSPAALIVIDGNGNTNRIDFNVVVLPTSGSGNLSPVAIARAVTNAADANCQAVVAANQIDNHSFDFDGTIGTRTVQPSGPFAVGTTTPVTLTVTDNQGASSSAETTVTVLDLTPPTVLNPVTDIAVAPLPGQHSVVVNYPVLNISDNCSSAGVNYTPPSGTAFGIGTNSVICEVVDGNGNSSTNIFHVIIAAIECDTIPGLAQRVEAIPLTGNFNGGRRNAMLKKLDKAQLNVTLKRWTSANYLLRGFIRSCSIYQDLGVLDFETATELIICATNIQNHLFDVP